MLRPALPPKRVRDHRSCTHRHLTTLLLLVGALGCEPLLSPPQYGEVRVSVTTESGIPIPGVWVNLYTGPRPIEYAFTDDAGRYTFERVRPGNYGVLAAVPEGMGEQDGQPYLVQDDLDVQRGAQRTVAFTVVRCSGAILVSVRDASGAPAVGVPMTLYTSAGPVDEAAAGTDGTHRFSTVPCGEYGVRLDESPGYTITPGAGNAFVDGVRITRSTPDVTVAFRVRRN